MAGVITYVQDLAMFTAGVQSLGNLFLCLYTNEITPSKGDTAASYTEAAGDGYLRKTLDLSAWVFSGGPPPFALYAQQSFGFTGALGDVRGYFLLTADGTLVGAEKFSDGPYTVQRPGDIVRVTPKIAAKAA